MNDRLSLTIVSLIWCSFKNRFWSQSFENFHNQGVWLSASTPTPSTSSSSSSPASATSPSAPEEKKLLLPWGRFKRQSETYLRLCWAYSSSSKSVALLISLLKILNGCWPLDSGWWPIIPEIGGWVRISGSPGIRLARIWLGIWFGISFPNSNPSSFVDRRSSLIGLISGNPSGSGANHKPGSSSSSFHSEN